MPADRYRKCPFPPCRYMCTSKWHLNRHITAVHVQGKHPMRGKWKLASSDPCPGPAPCSPATRARSVSTVCQAGKSSALGGDCQRQKITQVFPQRKIRSSRLSRHRGRSVRTCSSQGSPVPEQLKPKHELQPAQELEPKHEIQQHAETLEGSVCYVFGEGFVGEARQPSPCAIGKNRCAAGGQVLNLCSLELPGPGEGRREVRTSKGTALLFGRLLPTDAEAKTSGLPCLQEGKDFWESALAKQEADPAFEDSDYEEGNVLLEALLAEGFSGTGPAALRAYY